MMQRDGTGIWGEGKSRVSVLLRRLLRLGAAVTGRIASPVPLAAPSLLLIGAHTAEAAPVLLVPRAQRLSAEH